VIQWADPLPEDSLEVLAFQRNEGVRYKVIRSYLIGLLSIRLGEEDAALQCASDIERVADSTAVWDWALDCALGIRARIAWESGSVQRALGLMENVPRESLWPGPRSEIRLRVHERYLRAELLRANGDLEHALGWYAGLVESGFLELPYLAMSHLRRAEIYDELGEREKAAHHYSRFVNLWKDCDPELRPVVNEAEARMATLLQERIAS
jgi:tetratricopeptide (TPR) repeat protein